jgi:hypothetical protein
MTDSETNIDKDFLMKIYSPGLKREIISAVLEDTPDEEKITKLVSYMKGAKK